MDDAVSFIVEDKSHNSSLTNVSSKSDPVSALFMIFSSKGDPGTYFIDTFKKAVDTFGEDASEYRYGPGYKALLEHLQSGHTATVIKLPNPDF